LTKGNGLVIVEGNLDIKGNIGYESTPVVDTAKLASIAWLVKKAVLRLILASKILPVFLSLSGDVQPVAVYASCGKFSSGPQC